MPISPTAPGRRSPTARRWLRRNAAAKALLVLFHVTADTRWSDLPLSGAFVDMLKRIVSLANATGATDSEAGAQAPAGAKATQSVVPPTRVLDGFGAFTTPAADRAPGRRQFHRSRRCRPSARLLRPARRPGRGQYAGAERPSGAARCRAAQCQNRRLPPWRAARPAGPRIPRCAGALGDRRAGGDRALRRLHEPVAAPPRRRRHSHRYRPCRGGARRRRRATRRTRRRRLRPATRPTISP